MQLFRENISDSGKLFNIFVELRNSVTLCLTEHKPATQRDRELCIQE